MRSDTIFMRFINQYLREERTLRTTGVAGYWCALSVSGIGIRCLFFISWHSSGGSGAVLVWRANLRSLTEETLGDRAPHFRVGSRATIITNGSVDDWRGGVCGGSGGRGNAGSSASAGADFWSHGLPDGPAGKVVDYI